ncbi:hypothetical protein MGG_16548 [Pyricularia oryzae 70-15]|uniref:Uncharacterized protein n=1 Tax=Pyricularia oryzae (strain 70-15 / ATCC MYA-4617 / FGSC 8958) TaxID=242507 RepID=G4MLH9_PYRO7|nr:uncharacterized protein MGG_16548 [Pyricularia oryzae 70-15]EHA58500.1 hypothetical protein MGG_16548 [Pyricularia oryzae 70-15]
MPATSLRLNMVGHYLRPGEGFGSQGTMNKTADLKRTRDNLKDYNLISEDFEEFLRSETLQKRSLLEHSLYKDTLITV